MENIKEKWMMEALALAEKGRGRTNPNPMVGAIIVKDHKKISEGYHERCGEAHAEVNAIRNATEPIEGSEIYVTLEPCSHYGKTPPCVEAIIKAKIAKVYIGTLDPNPLVSGRGKDKLEAAGIKVEVGIHEKEIKELNKVFNHYITTKLPYVTLKTAMTLDGKIATKTGHSKWISCEASREKVHEMRNDTMAILTGIGTVNKDNPKLNTRLKQEDTKNPIRIIVDSKASLDMNTYLANTAKEEKTILFASQKASKEKIDVLKEQGIEVIKTANSTEQINVKEMMIEIGKRGIDSVLVEAGGTLAYSLIKEKCVNQINAFIAPKILGGKDSVTPVEGEGYETVDESIALEYKKIEQIDQDIYIEAEVKEG